MTIHNKRDKWGDREAAKDSEEPDKQPPTGTVGPGGSEIDREQGPGGAIEPDPPEDRG